MRLSENEQLIIVGLKEDGSKFRPSDWAERLCGSLCTFRNRRMYYSPLLRPAVIEGVKCVLVDHRLQYENEELFAYISGFISENHLKTQIQVK